MTISTSCPALSTTKRRRLLHMLSAMVTVLAVACSPGSSSNDPRANAREITELPEGTTFYLNDERGSPVATLDRHGNVVEERSYHAYGAEREPASAQEPWAFAGNELDATELGNFHARPYDARLGRFLAVDPEPLFNPNAQLNPIAFQAYSYAASDPVNLADPTGRSVWTKAFKFGVRLLKTGDVAQSIYGTFEDAVTLFDASASVTDRVIAGVSLATEVAPISLGDVKDASKALGALAGAGKRADKALDTSTSATTKAIGYHATHPQAASAILDGGFRAGTKPGRLGSGGVYVNSSPAGATAEFAHHSPGVKPAILEVHYDPGVSAVATIAPQRYVSSHPLNVQSISAPSLRAPNTTNTNVLNGSSQAVRVIE